MSFLRRVKYAAVAFGNIFAPKPAKASLHSGRNSSEMMRLWPYASGLHPDLAINQAERQNAVNRSQEEYTNNPVYQGHIRTLAKMTIGRGPLVQVVQHDDAAFAKQVETEWVRWGARIGLSEKLRLMRYAKAHSGEAFAILTNRMTPNGVSLNIKLIEASRVTDGRSQDGGGIVFDEFGEPAFYNVLETHPGISNASKKFNKIPASAVIHYRTIERPEQTRGVPEAASGLINYAGLHRYTAATIRTAENQACFTGVLETDAIEDGDSATPGTPIPITPGSFMTLPDGTRSKPLDVTQPTSNHRDFVNTVNSQNAMPLGLPAFLAQLNAAPYSYAGVRGDQVTLEKIIEVERDEIEKQVLARIFAAWFEEARMVYGWTMIDFDPELQIQWNWRGLEHIDPVKEATASKMLIDQGLSTLAIECAKRGLDWEDVQDQRAKEKKRAKSLGLTEESTSFSNTPIQKEEDPQDQPQDENEEQNA